MRRSPVPRLTALVSAAIVLAAAAPLAPPPPPAVRPVTETHFGVTVTDPYRYFENPKDPELAKYFKAQSAYTRAVLDALPGRAALAQRIAQLDNATESLSDVQPVGGTYFYEKRPAGANSTRLYARAITGGRERLVFDPDRFARSAKEHYTFDYYSPSPNGTYVAIGVSEGGSERTVLHVLDTRTGRLLPDVIERAIYIAPSWREDGRSFYYFRTPKAPANQPESEKDTKGVARLHVLGRNPDRDPAVFGYHVDPRIPFAPEDAAFVNVTPRSRWATAAVVHGVQNEIQVYVAPAAAVVGPRVPWRKIASYADDVTGGQVAALVPHRREPAHHRHRAAREVRGRLLGDRLARGLGDERGRHEGSAVDRDAQGHTARRNAPGVAGRLRRLRHRHPAELLHDEARLAGAGRDLRRVPPARRGRERRGLALRRAHHDEAAHHRRLHRLREIFARQQVHAAREAGRQRHERGRRDDRQRRRPASRAVRRRAGRRRRHERGARRVRRRRPCERPRVRHDRQQDGLGRAVRDRRVPARQGRHAVPGGSRRDGRERPARRAVDRREVRRAPAGGDVEREAGPVARRLRRRPRLSRQLARPGPSARHRRDVVPVLAARRPRVRNAGALARRRLEVDGRVPVVEDQRETP